MAHLVTPIDVDLDESLAIREVLEQLQSAHRYLVRLGAEAVQKASDITANGAWGTQQKRMKITFPDGDRPALISDTHKVHTLIEVINQCATMERLIDALIWASKSLPDYRVVRCHPTTSSIAGQDKMIPDNDIVLVNPEGRFALFEVSDVANSEKDGNRKEFKDLKSLGIRLANLPDDPSSTNPFVNRLFMVVSAEFGVRFRKRESYYAKNQPHFLYREHPVSDTTCIFEVLPPV